MSIKTLSPKIKEEPCTCAMLTLYRFVEPLALFTLMKNGPSHGYELLGQLHQQSLSDRPIDGPALYRTLRVLESNGNVVSNWETGVGGPARRQYSITRRGENHLQEWSDVLSRLSVSLQKFSAQVKKLKLSSSSRAKRPGK